MSVVGGGVGTNSTNRPASTSSVFAADSSVTETISAVWGMAVGALFVTPPRGRGRRRKPENLLDFTAAAPLPAGCSATRGAAASGLLFFLAEEDSNPPLREKSRRPAAGARGTFPGDVASTAVRVISFAAANSTAASRVVSSFFSFLLFFCVRKRGQPPPLSSPLSSPLPRFRLGLQKGYRYSGLGNCAGMCKWPMEQYLGMT